MHQPAWAVSVCLAHCFAPSCPRSKPSQAPHDHQEKVQTLSLTPANLPRRLLALAPSHTPGCSHVRLTPGRQKAEAHIVQKHPGRWGDLWMRQRDDTWRGSQTQHLKSVCRTPECSSNKTKESYSLLTGYSPSHLFLNQKHLKPNK